MFDDRNIMAEQHRVRRAIAVTRGVDVEGIDPDQSGSVLCEVSRRAFSEKRMIAARVFFRAPVIDPSPCGPALPCLSHRSQ